MHLDSSTREIPLTKGYIAVVDAADYPMVCKWSWAADVHQGTVYAIRGFKVHGRSHTVYLHRTLLLPEDGQVIDHVDGDGLNNRRSNLRIAVQSENCWNSALHSSNRSGFKGVYWDARKAKWGHPFGRLPLACFSATSRLQKRPPQHTKRRRIGCTASSSSRSSGDE